jgi:hypothetical protein
MMTYLTTNEVTSTALAARVRGLSREEAARLADIEIDLDEVVLCATASRWYLAEVFSGDDLHEVIAEGVIRNGRIVAI